MKTLRLITLLTTIALAGAACRNGKHTKVVVNNNGDKIKIEFAGQIVFSDDSTAIENISPGGYLKYDHNGRTLLAEGKSKDKIMYEIDSKEKQTLDFDDKKFLAEAVKEVVKRARHRVTK